MYYLTRGVLALLLPVTSGQRAPAAHKSPVAYTKLGEVRGVHLESFHQDAYLGLPFGKAPRLDKPQPIVRYEEHLFDATKYGTTCYGSGSN